MNKIPLEHSDFGGIRYKLSMLLDYGRSPLPFDVIFDTGSPFGLTLLPQDVLRMQISVKGFQKGGIVPLGSLKYQSYILKNKKLIMKDVNNIKVEFDVPEIYILINTKSDAKSMQEANSMPSLIGLKFLEDYNLSLNINGETKTGFIEKK